MIITKDDGSQVFAKVSGAMPCVRAEAITLTAADLWDLLELPPERLKEYLQTGPALRFGPFQRDADLKRQMATVQARNEKLNSGDQSHD